MTTQTLNGSTEVVKVWFWAYCVDCGRKVCELPAPGLARALCKTCREPKLAVAVE